MSGWNYRVCTKFWKNDNPKTKHITGGERSFEIHEVYYDDDDKPGSYTERSVNAGGETLEELKKVHKMMEDAFEKPVLDLDNWPNEYFRKEKR